MVAKKLLYLAGEEASWDRSCGTTPAHPRGHLLFLVKERCARERRFNGGGQISHGEAPEGILKFGPVRGAGEADSARDTQGVLQGDEGEVNPV